MQLVEDLRVGGLERMAVDLAIAHREAGHESSIYALMIRGDLADEAEAAGVRVTAFEKGPGFSLRTVARIGEQLLRDRPQVLHMHNSGVHHYGALAAWWAGVPVVVNTRHGVSQSNGQPFNDRWFRAVWPLTSQVIYVSDHSRRFYEDGGVLPKGKGTVIVNGLRLEPYRDRQAHPGAVPVEIRLGTVGRLVPVKGHRYLIDAFSRIADEFPHATLRIVGYGVLETDLQQQVKQLNLTNRVKLLGARSDIADQLADLDLFVFSSLSEGLPMTILEAMAAGLPIVSTRIGGIPEVAPEGVVAWYAEPEDADGLAAAIRRALRSNLSEVGARAREIAFAEYSLEQMQQKYESLYRRLLA